jgi:hypothetical protein
VDRLALLPPGHAAPATVYLARLSPRSQVAMRRALAKVAILVARYPTKDGRPLGGYARVDLDRVPWAALDAARLVHVREHLSASGSLATVRQALVAVRGVLGLVGVLDAARMAATKVPKSKPRVRAFAPTGNARTDALNVLRALGLTLPTALALDVSAWRVGGTRLLVRGRVVRVPDALGDVLDSWVSVRGDAPGPLVCRMVKGGRVSSALPLSISAASKALHQRPIRDPLRDKSAA